MITLLDLIDKLDIDQKVINDFKRENIFYVYELLEINPKTQIGTEKPFYLTKFQSDSIQRVLSKNNLRYVYELDEKEKQDYYEYLNSLWNKKKKVEIESLDIDFFNFPARIRNGLVRAGIDSLFKLSRINIRELYRIRNLGTSSILQILDRIHELGVYLHGEDISEVDKIVVVKGTYDKAEEESLLLIDEAKTIIERKTSKHEMLERMKKLNKIIESQTASEKEINTELISYMYMILDVLRNDENKDKIEEIENLLRTLYGSNDEDKKNFIKKN